MGRLDGRIVVVTGGAGFLGTQYCAAIEREGGVAVSLDISGGPGTYLCDITNRSNVVEALGAIEALVGPVDGLVNNAALNPTVQGRHLRDSGRLETLDYVALRRAWDVGVLGAIHCAQVFGTAMAARKRGVIVNISSELGLVAPNQALYPEGQYKPLHYSLEKHAMIGLTRWLATYWAGAGLRVNALALGGMENGQDKKFIAKRSTHIPLGRMAQPGEFDGPLVFLLSDASSYMTGAVISVDGGYTCL